MWDLIVNTIAGVLTDIAQVLQGAGIPYAYGFAIIVFTILIKLVTLPLTAQQYKSMRAQQVLQPKLQELQKKYKGDREKLGQAQMELYKEAGVNPLGGCLPLVIQLPVLYALFGALRLPSFQDKLVDQSFFFVPSLACPGTAACQHFGQGISWIWPLPPSVGWATAAPYLILAVLVVISQVFLQKVTSSMTPQMATSDNPAAGSMNQMMWIFSVLFGYYSLIFPSSLSLYYVVSNLLTLAQQYFMVRPMNLAAAAATPAPASPALSADATSRTSLTSGNSSTPAVQSSNGSTGHDTAARTRKPKRYKRK